MRKEKELEIKKEIENYLTNSVKTEYMKNKTLAGKTLTGAQTSDLRAFYIDLENQSVPSKSTRKATKYSTYKEYILSVRIFGLFIGDKDFIDVNREDIEKFLVYLNSKGTHNSNYIANRIRCFYTWLYYKKGLIEEDETPIIVRGIKYKTPVFKRIKANEVLTPMDIKCLIEKADNLRDKALISILFESACRVSEICDINIGDITIDQYGVIIEVEGKTGERNIRLIDSEPYLKNYLNNHPLKNDMNKPFFIGFSNRNYGTRLTPQGVRQILLAIGRKAEISKKIHPHWFRHSGLDFLARNGFTERDLKIRAGWGMGSSMVKVYIHYDEDEVNDKYAKIKGIKIKDKKQEENQLKPIICPRCEKLNPADSKYCNCGMMISLDIVKLEQLKKEANKFTNELMVTPIPSDVDINQGMMETLFQTMMKNPIVLEQFKTIIKEYG
jgi:site-specific recombinase XerD